MSEESWSHSSRLHVSVQLECRQRQCQSLGQHALGYAMGVRCPSWVLTCNQTNQFVNSWHVLDCMTAQSDEEADGCYRSTEHEKGLLVHDGTCIVAGHESRASCNDGASRGAGRPF